MRGTNYLPHFAFSHRKCIEKVLIRLKNRFLENDLYLRFEGQFIRRYVVVCMVSGVNMDQHFQNVTGTDTEFGLEYNTSTISGGGMNQKHMLNLSARNHSIKFINTRNVLSCLVFNYCQHGSFSHISRTDGNWIVPRSRRR